MAIHALPAPARDLVAICGKCSRKLDEKPLARRLARALDLPKPKRSRIRVVETRCLKLCPRGAVAVIHGRAPHEILIVPAGTSGEALAQRLDLPLPAAGETAA